MLAGGPAPGPAPGVPRSPVCASRESSNAKLADFQNDVAFQLVSMRPPWPAWAAPSGSTAMQRTSGTLAPWVGELQRWDRRSVSQFGAGDCECRLGIRGSDA